jgi:hypothetical protein
MYTIGSVERKISNVLEGKKLAVEKIFLIFPAVE